ncbi:MAG: hypothetical protein HYS12_19285 [Planctomycetes bacterium]|nr:hypothetical protein [Planctomycetota bacterium]
MRNTLIGRHIRRGNRILFAFGLVCWMLGLLIVLLTRRYLHNVLFGPFPIDSRTLLEMRDPDERFEYFVTVRGDRVNRTGFARSSAGSNEPFSEYVYLSILDKNLLLHRSTGHQGSEHSGTLQQPSAYERNTIRPKLETEVPALRGKWLPFTMDATSRFRFGGYLLVVAPLSLLGVTGLWLLSKATARSLRPEKSPPGLALSRLGNPEEVASAIDIEAERAVQVAGSHLSASWLWRLEETSVSVFRLDEIVWVYKTVLHTGLISTPSYKVFDRHGVSMQVTFAEPEVDRFIYEISSRVPWVITEYTPHLDALWHRNRQAFLELVDQRRQQAHKGPENLGKE